MKCLKKLVVLSLCPLYITNGSAACMGAGDDKKSHSQKPLHDESYSVQSSGFDYNNPSFEMQSLSPVFATSTELFPVYRTSPSNNTTTLQSQIFTQPGISPDPVKTSVQTSSGLLLGTFQPSHLTTIPIPRPPKSPHFITKKEVDLMKKDKAYTNQLLDLIYWNVIDNCYTLEEIKNTKYIHQTFKTSPDHRLWSIIYNLDAFSDFPGLADVITKYADGGLATAQFILGHMHMEGREVPKDELKALNYWRLSADQGLAKSQCSLGSAHYLGKPVPENKTEAVRLYTLAADQGYAIAKLMLGQCYFAGHGVEKSEVQALKYYFDANLEQSRNHITKLLTPRTCVRTDQTFSESTFFSEIEKQLGLLVSMYYPGIAFNDDPSTLLKTQHSKLAEYRSWIYDTLTKEAIPLVEHLKTVSPGFLINCLEKKEGVTILRAKTNPAPAFYHSISLQRNKKYYNIFGEENVIIVNQFVKVHNFFHKDVENKLKEIIGVGDITNNLKDEEKSRLKLENRLLSAQQLLSHAPEEKKPIFLQEVLNIQCKLDIINTTLSNLQKTQEARSVAQKEINNLKKLSDLLSDYVEKGAHGRNELFLENYPYLRAK